MWWHPRWHPLPPLSVVVIPLPGTKIYPFIAVCEDFPCERVTAVSPIHFSHYVSLIIAKFLLTYLRLTSKTTQVDYGVRPPRGAAVRRADRKLVGVRARSRPRPTSAPRGGSPAPARRPERPSRQPTSVLRRSSAPTGSARSRPRPTSAWLADLCGPPGSRLLFCGATASSSRPHPSAHGPVAVRAAPTAPWLLVDSPTFFGLAHVDHVDDGNNNSTYSNYGNNKNTQ